MTFLIGIAPQGTISFVSNFAGSCMSDKEITEWSGIMDLLLPGNYTTLHSIECVFLDIFYR